jgi:hypothetical protein
MSCDSPEATGTFLKEAHEAMQSMRHTQNMIDADGSEHKILFPMQKIDDHT